MSNLTAYTNENITIIYNNDTSETYLTLESAASILNISKKIVCTRLKGLKKVISNAMQNYEVNTTEGVEKMRLVPAVFIADWAVNDNPPLGQAMTTLGAANYLKQLIQNQI